MEILLFGALSAASVLLLLFKLGIRRVLGMELFADTVLTFFLVFVFAGTFVGMQVGLIAALIVSVTLRIMRFIFPREVIVVSRSKFLKPSIRVVTKMPFEK